MAFTMGEPNTVLTDTIRSMIIMAERMTGKTENCAQLPNALLIDILGHAKNYITKAKIWDFQKELARENAEIDKANRELLKANPQAMKKANYSPYGYLFEFSKYLKTLPPDKKPAFLIVDSLTDLEQLSLSRANWLFKQTGPGATYTGNNVIADLDYGKGQIFLKDAIKPITDNFFGGSTECTIFLGHLTTKTSIKEKELSVSDIDLTSQIKKLLAGNVEATGILSRNNTGAQNVLDFRNLGDSLIVGGRPSHIRGKEFLLSELKDDNGKLSTDGTHLTTFWENIFPDYFKTLNNK